MQILSAGNTNVKINTTSTLHFGIVLFFGCAVCTIDRLNTVVGADICTMFVVFQCAFNQRNLNIPLSLINGCDFNSILYWIEQ